jgi:dolichyl-diphosphooligosaccharide--protein glycosyltransferase
MAAKTPQGPAVGYTTESTRALLRVVILCFIAAAAISSRLFSVIRKPFFWLSFRSVEAIASLNCNCRGLPGS